MSNNLKPKISFSEELLPTNACEKTFMDNKFNLHSPYEIFRNNSTAVEVIVKEIKHNGKRQTITKDSIDRTENITIKSPDEDIKKLKRELHEANSNLEEAQRCFKVILCEMKKQLERANQRELQTQTKNLALQLEKEKLTTLLDWKTNLVTKLKREFTVMRRMLKVVMKGMQRTPPLQVTLYHSDIEYEEFEKDLRDSAYIDVGENSLDNTSAVQHRTSNK